MCVGQHLLRALTLHCKLPPLPAKAGCDGQLALKNVFERKHISWESPSWDLLLATRGTVSDNHQCHALTHFHVCGHQDSDEHKWDVSPLDATLNAWADKAAGKCRSLLETAMAPFIQMKFAKEPWATQIEGERTVSDAVQAICHQRDGHALLTCWDSL